MNKKENDFFWLEKPKVLIDTFDKFIPNQKMSIYQQMNSITLFCIYVLLILKIVTVI